MTERHPSASAETSPHQNYNLLGGPAVHNLAQVSAGYNVEMLTDGASAPAREVLCLDPAARAKQFAEDYITGAVPTTIVKDAWTGVSREGKPGFVTYFKVSEADVDAAGVPRELFTGSKFQYPGADEKEKLDAANDTEGLADFAKREEFAMQLDTLIAPEQRRTEVEAYYGQQPDKVDRLYKNDLAGVEKKDVGLETLHQAFELTDSVEGESAGGIRVLNFTETAMTEEHVTDIADALRYFSERTGGAIYDYFDNIVYVPKDHPSLKVEVRQADRTKKQMTRRGYMAPRTLVLSEWSLYPPEEQPPATAEGTAFFHSYLRPDEPAEGPGSPVNTVAQGRHRATIAHEMTHMALFRDDIPKARSLYARFNPVEWDAERGAAEFLGEEHLVPADETELAAFENKWQWLRNKAEADDRPQGEHFVGASQHDLTSGPLPRRLKNPKQPLPTEVTFKLTAAQ